MLTRTLGSNSAAEGLFVLVARQRDDGGVVEVDGVEEGLAEHAADGVGRLVWSVRLFCPSPGSLCLRSFSAAESESTASDASQAALN